MRLSADPSLWQLRVLLKRVSDDNWLTARADRVEQEEFVKPGAAGTGAKFAAVVNWSRCRRMPMAAIKREECYLDEDHGRGEMTAEDVDEMVRKHHPARGMKSAELGLRGEMQQVSREPPAGHKWVSMSEGDGFDLSIKLGDEITLGPQDLVTGNKAIHFTSVGGRGDEFSTSLSSGA